MGNVSQGGGGTGKSGGQPHEPSAADECGPAQLSHEQTLATAMSSPRSERLEGVPVSRGEGRGAKGKANGAWRHGRFTSEAVMLRRLSTVLTRNARKTMEEL